jgi:hypothetical protein
MAPVNPKGTTMTTYTITATYDPGHDAIFTINGTTFPAEEGWNQIAEAVTGQDGPFGCCDAPTCGGVEPAGPAYTVVWSAMSAAVDVIYAARYDNPNRDDIAPVTVTVTA